MSKTEKQDRPKLLIIKLGDHKIPARIKIRNLRNVKEVTGYDIYGTDAESMMSFLVDPITTVEVAYHLFKQYFVEAKLSQEDFEDLIDDHPHVIEEIREVVNAQMPGFSRLWKTVSTKLKEVQSGSTDQELIKAAGQAIAEGYGHSSSRQPSASAST